MTEPTGPTRPSGPTEPIERIEAALSRLGDEHEPPRGWEARVLAAVATKRRRPWWMYAAPGLGLAAAAAVAVVLLVPHAQPLAFALEVTAEGSAVVRSGQVDERVVGDAVHITASSTKPHLAVRVYRDDIHLVISCPEHPTCRGSKDSIAVDFTIAEVGTYLVLAATADDALPALSGTFDADFAALTRAGVLEHQRKLIVR